MDNKQWHGGKGSKRRNSNEELYADNWEKIFGKRKPKSINRIKRNKNGR